MAAEEPTSGGVLDELLARCRRDHEAWINGDGSGYALPDDGTIMGAVGGAGPGGAATAERQAAVARQWRSGTGTIDFVGGSVHGDVAWLAFVERATVVVEGDEREHRWDLRVTEVFRREDGGWHRVHRHADPLVERRSLADSLSLVDGPGRSPVGAALPLVHLNLAVADVERSIAFYRRWFGFARPPRTYEDGTVFIGNDDGFDLALHPRAARGAPEAFHFGFRAADPAVVMALRTELADAGVPLTETCDEDDYVNLKCLDPDGYEIEVYWEPPTT